MRTDDGSSPEESEFCSPLPNLLPGVRVERDGSGICTEADLESATFDFGCLSVESVTVFTIGSSLLEHP